MPEHIQDASAGGPNRPAAETAVDDFFEGDFDWQAAVRRNPLPALGLAALGGFFLGSRYGLQLITDVSAFAADQLMRNASQFVGAEFGMGEGDAGTSH